MLASTAAVVTAVLVVTALAMLLSVVLVRRRAGRLTRRTDAWATSLTGRAETLAGELGNARKTFAAANAAIESGLWTLARLDERLDRDRIALANRRQSMDTLRGQILAASSTIDRVKSGARTVLRAIELRRVILG